VARLEDTLAASGLVHDPDEVERLDMTSKQPAPAYRYDTIDDMTASRRLAG